jgi:hypothetical protein
MHPGVLGALMLMAGMAVGQASRSGSIAARTHRLLSWLAVASASAPEAAYVHGAWARQARLVTESLCAMLDRERASPEDYYRGLLLLKAYVLILNRHYRMYGRVL